MNINTLKLKNLTSFNKNCVADTDILLYNKKQVLNFINFYTFIQQAFKLKHVYIDKAAFYLIGKNLVLNLLIYYSSLKVSFFKKKSKSNFGHKSLSNIYTKNGLFPKQLVKLGKLNSATITFKNLNNEIDSLKALNLYKKIKKSIFTLLKKKRYLLIDLIRVTVLLIDGKISVKFFTMFISQIFATLTKKSHNRFFLILKSFFKMIISDAALNEKVNKIEGIKLKIGGRLRGKTRADVRSITVGTVPLQTNSKCIEYYKQHIFTVYGAFGLKLWIFRAKQGIKINA